MLVNAGLPLCLPSDTVKPDYGENGLFALALSIRDFLDGKSWVLPGAGNKTGASRSGRLLFLLVDGLGDEFLRRHGEGSALLAQRQCSLTSVFPSTTACAVTTLLTALPPAAHGLTGWYINDRRFGGVMAPLPMKVRNGGEISDEQAAETLFPYAGLFNGRYRATVEIAPQNTAFSPFSRRHSRGAQIRPYRQLEDMATSIAAVVEELDSRGGYIYAYYPLFDTLCHDHGCESVQALEEFRRIDRFFEQLCVSLTGKDIDIVVSADHGFIDSPADRRINLNKSARLQSLLEAPLFGERRAAFCQVRSGSEAEFERLANDILGDKGICVCSSILLEAGMFGPRPFHPLIKERIGTHTLLMEPGWTIYDILPGESLHPMIGVHGGLSAREMLVPLIHRYC